MQIFKQFNKYAQDNQSLIQKALTTASGVGEALIPENLEKIITDTLIRLSPELAMADLKKISGKTHEFNRLVERPARGGAIGESATTPVSNSKTVRDSVTLKIVRRKGKVTNFLNDTSEEYIDAVAYEMDNHIQSHVLDLIYYMVWGNAGANAWEFSGLQIYITTNYVDFSSGDATGVVPSDLKFLDAMIDTSNRKGGARHRRAFMMSPEMLSLVSSLLTNVRLNQGLTGSGLTQVDIGGGWRLNAYRDIPIIETTSLAPIEDLTSTVTVTGATSGGNIADGTYYVYVTPVTYEGEQGASAVEAVTISGGGGAGSIEIDLDAPHTTESVESVLSYKIYIGSTTGEDNATLRKWVPAFTYDAEGAPDGDNGVDETIVVTSLTPDSSVPTHMQSDLPIRDDSGYYPESIVLWDLDPIQGLGKMPFTNTPGDRFEGLVVSKDLAEVDDWIEFLTKSYTCLTPSFDKTSYWLRGVRRA